MLVQFWKARVLDLHKPAVIHKLDWVKSELIKWKEVEDDKTVENSGFKKF